MAVVVADAVARHGGIPELIPKLKICNKKMKREEKRGERNKKGAMIEVRRRLRK